MELIVVLASPARQLRAAGFTLDREIGDWGSSSDYCLVFRKPTEDGRLGLPALQVED